MSLSTRPTVSNLFEFCARTRRVSWMGEFGSFLRSLAIGVLGGLTVLAVAIGGASIGPTLAAAVSLLLLTVAALSLLDNFVSSVIRSVIAKRLDLAACLAEAQRLSKTGSFDWKIAGSRLTWSDETFRIFELDPGTTPSCEIVLSLTHPDDLHIVRDVFDRAREAIDNFDVEHRILLPDGSIKHLRVVARVIADHSDERHFVGAVMDITAQKTTFADLQRSEQRYKQLFNLVPVAMWELDASRLKEHFSHLRNQGVTDLHHYFDEHPEFLDTCMKALVYREANERAIRLFGGRGADDFVGHSVGRGWKERPDTFRRAMESRFRGDITFEEETRMSTLDGRVVDVLFTTARLGQISDTSISVIGAMDISERVLAQQQLQQHQADVAHAARVSMLGELTASIAHEVNQPLGAIATTGAASLRWLDQPEPNIKAIRQRIERMVEDAQRAADIITRIRRMASNAKVERQVLRIDDVVRDAMLFLRHEARSKAVTITHRPAKAAPPIFGDVTQIQQLVVNLCINAIQATQFSECADRQITIYTSFRGEDAICCTVEDSGPGIAPAHLDRVFESFFTTKKGGLGIGLAICRTIVDSHGGRISVDNDSSHGGARFHFTLPVATMRRFADERLFEHSDVRLTVCDRIH